MNTFTPHPLLRNPHAMTLASTFWMRRFPRLPDSRPRLFAVEPGSSIRGECHWQGEPRRHPTLVLVHGLEGSAQSGYMQGTAELATAAGFNVVRLNQRNCGNTEHLTPTLYNSGMSGDYRAVLTELIHIDRLPRIFFAGFSMGGNLVLKMAGELGDAAPVELAGVAAVAPALELSVCADAIDAPGNFLYRRHFVRKLMERFRRKAYLYPQRYTTRGLPPIGTIREFDEHVTAPYCGFRGAAHYYDVSSAMRTAGRIRVPTLIIAAQDDPLVPFAPFRAPAIASNPAITLVDQQHGGHCAFISAQDGEERFWVEGRIVDWLAGACSG
ncbi:MAG TPA: alpha/beta fold hydrolase [Candidatus Acidoferrales bacterium]